jgi:hypothetical protein
MHHVPKFSSLPTGRERVCTSFAPVRSDSVTRAAQGRRRKVFEDTRAPRGSACAQNECSRQAQAQEGVTYY